MVKDERRMANHQSSQSLVTSAATVSVAADVRRLKIRPQSDPKTLISKQLSLVTSAATWLASAAAMPSSVAHSSLARCPPHELD
jgi:hypothetical protein